jgi:ATP synthase mitochondrial F1 complex assembly factor 1
MKFLKNPSLRRLFLRSAVPPRFQQRRWARIQDVRFHATQPNAERILDRYKEKLSRKAKEYVAEQNTLACF